MAKLKVMCARSMHVAAGALGEDFARASGHAVEFDFGTVGALFGEGSPILLAGGFTFATRGGFGFTGAGFAGATSGEAMSFVAPAASKAPT